MNRFRLSSALGVLLLASPSVGLQAQWTQWGGPDRNFSVPSPALATDWSEGGPGEIWSRPLGDGYSSILVEGDRLYTMHREGGQDVVVALNRDSGQTIWRTAYDAPMRPDMVLDFGPGPISTPLLAGDRLFTVSSTVRFHCLSKIDGKILWSKDLMEELNASHMGRGFGSTPIAYGDTVILAAVGREHGMVAFRQEDGEVVWKSSPFSPSYSAPLLTTIGGVDMLLVAMGQDRAGLDPATGEILWRVETGSPGPVMATQILGSDLLLFSSAAYSDGSRCIEIEARDGKFEARQLWYSRKMRVMYAPFVRIGDFVYGSSGDFGPAFLVGMNVKTGEVAWRERGFSRAAFLHADDKVLILDEEGDLAIATASPQGLEVHSRAKVLERLAWSPPSLADGKLYLRNRETIKALDLRANP